MYVLSGILDFVSGMLNEMRFSMHELTFIQSNFFSLVSVSYP